MQPHLHLTRDPRYARVIVCGSPERAKALGALLKDCQCIAQNREYHSYFGTFEGTPILVTLHGIGGAGAAICFHELIEVGAQVIVRLGTAGGFYSGAKIGDIVVATAAVRRDGASPQMVPTAFPAVADLDVTSRLVAGLRASGWQGHSGIVLTNDLFYRELLDDKFSIYAKAGALAVEMECATLFVMGSLKRIRTGAVLVLDGDLKGSYDNSPARLALSIEQAFRAVLKTLVETPIAGE